MYWYFYEAVAILYLYSLVVIDRWEEKHHGYYGLVLAALPWWQAKVAGMVLLADELYQHGIQAWRFIQGYRPIPDFSPIHRAYVWTYRKLATLLT